MDTPNMATIMEARSETVFWWVAAITPSGTPTQMEISILATASVNVLGKRVSMSAVTLVPY